MATLVHASTDWQVFVNKNGGMCKMFNELHEELKSILEGKGVENTNKKEFSVLLFLYYRYFLF